jgi:hypothetical protein
MSMVMMRAGMRGCWVFCAFRLCVMHPVPMMPLVMVHLGEYDLRGKSRDRNQRKGKTPHRLKT